MFDWPELGKIRSSVRIRRLSTEGIPQFYTSHHIWSRRWSVSTDNHMTIDKVSKNKKPTNWLGPAKRCTTKFQPKAVGRCIFGHFLKLRSMPTGRSWWRHIRCGCRLRGLPLERLSSTVPCNRIFGSVSCRQTCPNHDNLRRLTLTVRTADIQWQ